MKLLLRATALLAIVWLAAAGPFAAGRACAAVRPIPVLAYYYIWFNSTSWHHAKIDYPLAGRYSSGNTAVMAQQVRLAKQVGITGFLVSWKNTPVLDRRLASIRRVAAAAGFKLAIMLEGRDFYGKPLPMQQVDSSFAYIAHHYAGDPVFNIFGRTLVAWSGTWAFTRAQMASVSSAYRPSLMILATERQPADYQAVAGLFAGDAYYWSSADPLHTPGYARKLDEFSAVVHRQGGLWIAPAAPGFDAQKLGGARVVPRRGGQTLRLEMNAAMSSSPDAIGLISWNEYSENSEVEPSRLNGGTALRVIASIEHTRPPLVQNFDSSAPSGFQAGPAQYLTLGALLVLLAGSVAVLFRRSGGRGSGSSPRAGARSSADRLP
jgi:Glycosyl hydrolase family 71